MSELKEVIIYSDGACSVNPGIGGWGAILIYKNVEKEICGSEEYTTNNRMELTASIEALKCLKEPCKVDIYTDSSYLCNSFANGWVYNWQRNGWKTSNKTEVLNQDLWEQLLNFSRQHKISWHKVKGHADNTYNNRCDKLATNEVSKLQKEIKKKATENAEKLSE